MVTRDKGQGRWGWRWPVMVAALVGLVVCAGVGLWVAGVVSNDASSVSARRYERLSADFDRWLGEEPKRQAEYRAFETYLHDRGVEGVVETWQLTLADSASHPKCRMDFVLPPREQWPHIVPTLRLVRDVIIPVTGEVRVASAFRPKAVNDCVGGASRSAHVMFSAVDLVPVRRPADDAALIQMFDRLCDTWRRSPPRQGFGFGAYLDQRSITLKLNTVGRFHVDTRGKRTWGHSYKAASSFCNAR